MRRASRFQASLPTRWSGGTMRYSLKELKGKEIRLIFDFRDARFARPLFLASDMLNQSLDLIQSELCGGESRALCFRANCRTLFKELDIWQKALSSDSRTEASVLSIPGEKRICFFTRQASLASASTNFKKDNECHTRKETDRRDRVPKTSRRSDGDVRSDLSY